MKKKKGFTLIELLAVIVVLAVIMVIAVPKILEVIENAEKQAYKESAELMAHTATLQYNTSEVDGTAKKIPEEGIVYTFTEGVQTVSGDFELLKFKGDKPYSGTITLTKDKKVIIDKLVSKNQKWCAIKEAGEKQARVGRSTDPDFNCKIDGEDEVVVEDKTACELATNDDETEYYIDSPCDLYEFSYRVNSGESFSGKVVKLRNNLDMSDIKDISNKLKNKYQTTDFSPIGGSNNQFDGTFDGKNKTISNLTIDTINDSINSNENFVGLFGWVSNATIYGLNINNFTIIGNEYVGGLIGNTTGKSTLYGIVVDDVEVSGSIYSGGLSGVINTGATAKDIMIDNINVHSTEYASGFAHVVSANEKDIESILIKSGTVSVDTYNSAVISSNGYGYVYNTVVEDIDMDSPRGYYYIANDTTYNIYYSNDCLVNDTVLDGFDSKGVNDINVYEAAGLDTWIGGDQNNNGYYFDYDKKGIIVLKNTEKDPITFNLSKDDDGNYLIENEQDWKEASTMPNENYKLENDIDFSSDKYYMLSSINNSFTGTLNGNDKTVSNVEINGNKMNYLGLFGHSIEAKIYGINFKNIKISGYDYVGIIGYMWNMNMYAITIDNINMSGRYYISGLAGVTHTSTIKEILLDNIVISSTRWSSGLTHVVDAQSTINNILVKKGNISTSGEAGLIGSNSYYSLSNTIVENVAATGSTIYTSSTAAGVNMYHSDLVSLNGTFETSYGFSSEGINDINAYESAGLDTWIGGDNDSSGYYFDYDNNGIIVLKSTKKEPITFNLKKDSEGNYLIENEQDWKEASTRVVNVNYKLENDIDFSSDKYYMLGSINNSFAGTLYGNDKTVSNVEINGSKINYLGLIGRSSELKMYGINFKNIKISGYDYVGIIGYMWNMDIYAITIDNINMSGRYYISGLAGVTHTSTIKEILLNDIDISSTRWSSGLTHVADAQSTINNILVKKGNISTEGEAGLIGSNSYYSLSNTIVENVAATGSTIYTSSTATGVNMYHSDLVSLNGNYETSYGFSSTLIGDLDYYAGKIETLYNGDANGTGYFFDYVQSKGGIYLVKAYTPVETEEPTEQTGCTITYGEVESGCYLYKSGVHGNYLYWAATSEETGTGAACTGTGRDAAFRQRIYYNCN